MRDAVGIANGIADVSGTEVPEGEQREAIQPQSRYDSFKVEDLRLQGVVRHLAVG